MDMPWCMKSYLRHNGWHFTKDACEFAVSRMKKKNSQGKQEQVKPMSKEEVDEMLRRNGIEIENRNGYDHVYVANKLKADMLKSSLEDERHWALGIKDIVDDIDQPEGNIFHGWYASMMRAGERVPWEDIN